MTVARVGTAQIYQSSTQDTTHSVTIPSGCDCVIVMIGGYWGDSTTALVDELGFDGSGLDFTQVGYGLYGAGYSACGLDVYVMTASDPNWPGVGTHTLHVRAPAARANGYYTGIAYYTGVDQSDPIGDTESHTAVDDGPAFTSALSGVAAEDMGVICTWHIWNSSDVSGGGQSVIFNTGGAVNDTAVSMADELGESALEADSGSENQLICLAFALNFAPSGGPIDLEGTTDGQAAVAGELSVARALEGATAGQGSTSGAIVVQRALEGSAGGQATVVGAIVVQRALEGSAGGHATVVGALGLARPLAGLTEGQSAVAGELHVLRGLVGQSDGSTTAAGDLHRNRGFAGLADGEATVAGALTRRRGFVGLAAASASVAATITLALRLQGVLSGTGTATADLTRVAAAVVLPEPNVKWRLQTNLLSSRVKWSFDSPKVRWRRQDVPRVKWES